MKIEFDPMELKPWEIQAVWALIEGGRVEVIDSKPFAMGKPQPEPSEPKHNREGNHTNSWEKQTQRILNFLSQKKRLIKYSRLQKRFHISGGSVTEMKDTLESKGVRFIKRGKSYYLKMRKHA